MTSEYLSPWQDPTSPLYRSHGHHHDARIDAAIAAAHQSHPYYSGALGRLRIVADPAVATMGTSAQWVTHYNPAAVAGWTTAETAAVLVHELEHLLRDHHGRCGDRDPHNFNVAGDAEINQRLPGLPEGAVYPESIGSVPGRTAEIYYGIMGSRKDPEPEPGTEPGEGEGEGEGEPQPGDGPGDGSQDGPGQPGEGKPGKGSAQCGSAAGGPTQDHERGDAANPGSGAENGGEDARREVAERVLDGYGVPQAGTEAGDALREWAESEIGIDRAAWYTALASVVGSTLAPYGAPTRYRWPGHRDIRDVGGAMLPRWVGERPSCAVVIDTSSSITPEDINMARAAGHYIGRIAEAVYYSCDTEATRLGTVLPERIPGGGGTRLTAGIAMAIAEGARAVVVITDCVTPWPDEDPGVPIIIGANAGAWTHVLRPGAPEAMARRYTPPEWTRIISVVNPE